MNKLNLLSFASILSIQTPVINQAYAQGTQQEDIDQEEEEEEEEVQAELSANDFQNMNEADFDSIDDGIKRHIHRKLSELGNGYQVAFLKMIIMSLHRFLSQKKFTRTQEKQTLLLMPVE